MERSLHDRLKHIAELEEQHKLCGVRFSLKGADIHSLKDCNVVVTTGEVVDHVEKAIEQVLKLDGSIDTCKFREPQPYEE